MDLYSYFYNLVKQIPRGRVSTYGALARALGDIRASRACGVMLSQNPNPPIIPCHRVVMSDGSIGGFTHPDGIKRKMELLRGEGIVIKKGKIENFQQVFFDDFRTDYPLRRLREEQKKLRSKVELKDDFFTDLIGGVDISYSIRNAFGCLMIMDSKMNIINIVRKKSVVNFPYIPTYFAFREEPIISELLKDLHYKIILLVDGNGILHPLKFGLASHIGVKNDIVTIGVAKSLLLGRIEKNYIYNDNEKIGYFLKSGRKKGVYISPGHKITLKRAIKIVKDITKFKNPEPLRLAHICANEMRREFMARELRWQ